jgi:hypothetical protein
MIKRQNPLFWVELLSQRDQPMGGKEYHDHYPHHQRRTRHWQGAFPRGAVAGMVLDTNLVQN